MSLSIARMHLPTAVALAAAAIAGTLQAPNDAVAVEKKEPKIVAAAIGEKLAILGHEVTVKLASRATAGEYYVFEVLSPPGAGVPPHVHSKEDEIIHVLDGEFEVSLAGQTHRATGGTIVHFPRGVPHGFRNAGTTRGRALWVVVPGGGFEKFFGDLAALPVGGPPNPDVVAAIFAKHGMKLLAPK